MNKKLTAWLLTLAIICTIMPTVSAAADSPAEGVLMERTKEMKVSGKVIDPIILPQKEHQKITESSEPDAEFIMSCNYSAEEEISSNYGEYLTSNFSTYGAQLPTLIYQAGQTTVNVGSALFQMYNNMKTDLGKGVNGAIFRGDAEGMKKLGVTISLPNVSKDYYDSIAKDMCWTVYRCIDSDFPEMFYSNGYCKVAYAINGSNLTLYSLPQYRKGFTTLAERTALNSQMQAKVNELVNESMNYPTAYDKIKFFHDWLCANNSYNHEATQSTAYSANISGSPWSAVGALLSSTNSSIPGPVCEAYSRAFQLLCQKIGVMATVIVSESGVHMWNNVRYGQVWTGVDITWDDSSNSYNYFFKKVNGISGHWMDDNDFSTWLSYPELSVVSGSGELPFYDVPDDYWARSFIQKAYDTGYITGMSCVNFGVNSRVTRAQFATILYSIAGKPDVAYINRFIDVPEGKWYTDAILWAYQNGIAEGYANGNFGINDAITREQTMTMLYQHNLMVNKEGPELPDDDLTPTEPKPEPVSTIPIKPEPPAVDDTIFQTFADADQIHAWAYCAISWAIDNNIITGYADYTLKPLGEATRSECAVMVSKIA